MRIVPDFDSIHRPHSNAALTLTLTVTVTLTLTVTGTVTGTVTVTLTLTLTSIWARSISRRSRRPPLSSRRKRCAR